MHVAFDAVMLSLYLHPAAKPPKPVRDLSARIELLIDELEAAGAKIIIPTPVLSEFLVVVGPKDGASYITDLSNSEVFDIKPFDQMAAIEAAEMHRKAATTGDKKAGSRHRWQVVKVDRQFVAVAKVNGVSEIYSDDDGVRKLAEAVGIRCKGAEDLPAPPPPDPQGDLFADLTPSSSAATTQSDDRSPGDQKPTGAASATDRREDHEAVPAPQPPRPSRRARRPGPKR